MEHSRLLARYGLALALAVVWTGSQAAGQDPPQPQATLQLLVVFDGLRPDYVTPERMPNLSAWSSEGVFFENHHSVFPTVTRVNASSFSTGTYPAKHGLMGNSVHFPVVSATKSLNTGDRKVLEEIDRATGGKLLTAPTVGEILQSRGKKLMVFSAGSTGSCYLLNPRVAGGAVFHPTFTLPESLHAEVERTLGPEPAEDTPNDGYNRRTVDALLHFGLGPDHPAIAFLWFTDPDHTAHPSGMGSERTNLSLKLVDVQFGRILDGLKQTGLYEKTNLFVTSDHGFSTHTGTVKEDLNRLLIARGLKQGPQSKDVLVIGHAIHVENRDREKIRKVVEELQKTDWIGALFTAPLAEGSDQGWVPGTFSTTAAHWAHERAGDILFSHNWTDGANEHGYRGTTTSQGVAGHGSSSPFDVHNTLIAVGPDLKRATTDPVPSANVDLAPTLLSLAGIPVPEEMDGRVLEEALEGGPDPKTLEVRSETLAVEVGPGTDTHYRLELSRSWVGDRVYFDFTQVTR